MRRGLLAFALALVTLLALAPIASAAGAAPDVQIVVRDLHTGKAVSYASGEIEIVLLNANDVFDLHVLLVWPDGIGTDKALNATSTSLDTTELPNGYYKILVMGAHAPGQPRVDLAERAILVENARTTPQSAAGALAAGAAVSLVGPLLAAVKSALAGVGSNAVEERSRLTSTRGRLQRTGIFVGGAGSLVVAALGLVLLAILKAYADQPTLAGARAALPIVGAAVLVIAAADLIAEAALARAAGGLVRYRVWWTGALALVISSFAFHSSFGYPGFLEEVEEREASARHGALRAAGSIGATLALMLLFLVAGETWRWDFAQHGIDLVLMGVVTLALPLRPLPGHALWQWRPLAWVAACAALVALYLVWNVALLAPWAIVTTAMLGAALFVAAFYLLGREEPSPHEEPDAARA